MALEDLEAQAQDQTNLTNGVDVSVPNTNDQLNTAFENQQTQDKTAKPLTGLDIYDSGKLAESSGNLEYLIRANQETFSPKQQEIKGQEKEQAEKTILKQSLIAEGIQSYLYARGIPVDNLMKAEEIGKTLNIPQNVVLADMPTYERQYAQTKFGLKVDSDDTLLAFLSDPKNVNKTHDDLEALSNFTGVFKGIYEAPSNDTRTAEYASKGIDWFNAKGQGEKPKDETPQTPDNWGYMVGNAAGALPFQLARGAFNKNSLERSAEGLALGTVWGGTAGSIIPGAGTLAGASFGGLRGAGAGLTVGISEQMAKENGALVGLSVYDQLREKGISHEKAFQIADNARNNSQLLGEITETLSNAFGAGHVAKAIMGQSRRAIIREVALGFVRNALEEGTIEAVQATGDNLIQEQAKQQAGLDNIYSNPTSDKFGKLASDAGTNFVVGAAVGGLYTGIGKSTHAFLSKMAQKAPEALATEAQIIQGMDTATQTLTHARDPQTFNTLAQTATDGKEGSIDRDIVIAEAQADPELWRTIIPDLDAKIAQSEQTGEAISFPLGNWITYGANNERIRTLTGDVRFSPDGATANEVRAGTLDLPDDVKAEIASTFQQINGQMNSPEDLNRQWVKDDILKKITQFKEIAPADRQAFAELFTSRKEAQAKQNEYRNGGVKEEYLRNPVVFQSVDEFNADTLARQALGEQQIQEGGDSLSPPLEDVSISETTEPAVPDLSPVEQSSNPLQLAEQPAPISEQSSQVTPPLTNDANGLTQESSDLVPAPQTPITEPINQEAQPVEKPLNTLNQSANARIVMDAAKKVIQLFKGKGNVSSLIHEMGHLTLGEFIQDATTAPEGTSQQLKTDYETTKKWWKDSSQYLLDLHTKRNMFGLKKAERAKELEMLNQIKEKGGTEYLAGIIDNNLQATDELSKYAYDMIHELTARGTEVYVMEGKAPNKGLARVFERFKKALTDIYETFSRLNAPLSDEMREVFGRLLSAEQTQEQVTKDLNLEPMFPTQEASGMSKAEYARYREKIADNTASLSQKLLKKTMKALRVQKTKEGAEKLESITARLEKESKESKPIQTYEWLSNSNVTIDPVTIVSAYGKDAVKLFPKELLSKEGISLQSASDGAGYAEFTDFANDLKRLQQMKANLGRSGAKMSIEEARKETVKRQAEQELKDWASPESLYDEAVEDIHTSGYEEALTTELNTLSKKGQEITGANRFPDIDPASLKEYVKDLFSRTPLKDILKKNKYLNAERRAGNKAQRHLLDGNYELAYASKREQIVSHLMYKEALAFEKNKAKADRLFGRIAKEKVIKGVNHDSMAIMHRILQDQGYKTARSQRPSRQGYFTPELEQYFTDKNGNPLSLNEAINSFLQDDKTGTRDTIYVSPQLKQGTPPETIQDFQALFDTIQSIFEHGKAEQELYLGGKRQNFVDTVNKIVETGREGRNLKTKPARASKNSLSRWQALKEKTSDGLALIPASVVRVSTIFNRLDQYQHDGNLTQLLNRMQDGLGKFLDYSSGFKQSMKQLEKSWGSKRFSKWRNSLLNERIENDLLGDHENNAMLDMYKSDVIAIALNRGTADSFRKLVEGRSKREDGTLTGWTAENVDALLDKHMTKEDWEFVQMLWKEVGKSWDELNALSKRLNGWGLDKTVEIPIQTKFGIIEGGYYPLLYDDTFKRVATAEEVGQSASFGNALDISALKNRSERVVKPVSLRLFKGLEKAQRNAYGLYLAESWRDMSKVLSNPKVKKMIVDVQGEPAYNAIIDMMEEAKSPNRQNASMADYVQNWGNHLHAGGVIVNFAYAIKPMFDSFSEFFVAPLNRNISKLGYAKNLGKVLLGDAFLRLSRNPDTEYAWARQFDAVKALDQSQQQRWDDFSGQLNKRWLVSRGLKHVSDFGFTLLELTSKMTSTAIARTAYEGFVNKHPDASQAEIAEFVNKTVRDTHISRNILDTPLTQRNKRNSHLKWFMTFSLKMTNQVMDMFYESKDAIFADGGKRTKLERTGVVFKNVMMGILSLMIPQISYMYLSNKMAEDDDGTIDWVKSLLFSPFQAISSGFPVLRDFADILFTNDPFAGNNLDSRYRSFSQAVKDAKKLADSKNEYGTREVNTLLRLFGTVSHAPVRPIMYGEYLYGLNTGDIQYNEKGLPATIQDIQRGYQP